MNETKTALAVCLWRRYDGLVPTETTNALADERNSGDCQCALSDGPTAANLRRLSILLLRRSVSRLEVVRNPRTLGVAILLEALRFLPA